MFNIGGGLKDCTSKTICLGIGQAPFLFNECFKIQFEILWRTKNRILVSHKLLQSRVGNPTLCIDK